MRILVHEFVTGGGLAGREAPSSLRREGAAMLEVLVEDLVRAGHEPVVGPVDGPLLGCDGVWLIAPETGGRLQALVASLEARGVRVFGSGSASIARASDKAGLARLLQASSIPCPATRVVKSGAEADMTSLEYPVIVKPVRGAGSEGVSLVADREAVSAALRRARAVEPGATVLLQAFVRGVPASVSLLSDGASAAPLAVSSQAFEDDRGFAYTGGATPIRHPLVERAKANAVRAVEAIGGLRGYIGVDVVLTDSEAVVIEINARLTTAYLGVRQVLDVNVAALALDACAGHLGPVPDPCRAVSFEAVGPVSVA